MAPSYKLYYFDIPSCGEPIRFIFNYAGIEFEDHRVTLEEWKTLKPKLPFRLVPVLEYNGKMISQSKAICRYAAKLAKLVGEDDWENLEIDAIVDTLDDFRLKFTFAFEPNETLKKRQKDEAINQFLPFYMPKFEAIVGKNNGFFVRGKLTWADLYFVSLIDMLSVRAEKDITENCPNIRKLRDYVLSIENIKKYVARRPKWP